MLDGLVGRCESKVEAWWSGMVDYKAKVEGFKNHEEVASKDC